MEWFYLSMAIIAEIIATTALKASSGFTRPLPTLLAVAGYGVAFFLLSLTLHRIPLGVAYAIWSAAGIVLISLAGLFLFGQRLDAPAIVGIALIVAGVTIIKVFSQSIAH